MKPTALLLAAACFSAVPLAVSAAEAPAAPAAVERNPAYPDLEEVIVTWKCHLDIGYTHSVPEVVHKYRTSDMDKILDMFEKTKDKPKDERFLWMLPAWAMDTVLDKDQDPARRAKLEQAVKDGRLLWHAIPFTFESDAADLEELVRGLGYGSRLARKFGVPLPTDSKQTDMPEQAWVMPTLLANAGVKFMHLGANPGSKPWSEHAKIPTLSWWEGADGSRILLGYSPVYNWGHIVPPKGWKRKTWLALFVENDNAGPPSPKKVEALLAEARKKLPGVKIRFGRPADFADAILKEEKELAAQGKPTLPVIRADMPDTWCYGQMSTPQATGIHRRAAPLLGTLGQLDTTLRAEGLATGPVAELLAEGYKNGGFYAEHTWGVNGAAYKGRQFRSTIFKPDWRQKYDEGYYKIFDETYEYHMDYGRKAMRAAQDGIAPRMKLLAESVQCDGPRVVVFNPLPWARGAHVEVQAKLAGGAVIGVKDVATGQPAAFTYDGMTNVLRISAAEIPPGGYKTFALEAGMYSRIHAAPPAFPADGKVVTARFTATFDLEKGGISSLIENATGRELVAQGGHALGQFMHERFDSGQVAAFCRIYVHGCFDDFAKKGMPGPKESPYAALTPKGWRAAITRTAIGDEVVLTPSDTLGLAKGYELRFTFPKAESCVDVAWRVEGKEPNPIPEGGWLCLPFKVETPAFRIGRVGGTIDPAKDISFGGHRSLFTVDRGVTVRAGEAGAGVGVASADLPLWSLGKPGLWLYEPTYVPTKPELFVNLYNNEWTTNYPLWTSGSWQASLRLWPVAAGANEEQADFTPSWELRQGAVAAFADGKGGAQPATQAGVALSRKGTRVTAFCPNPDGEGTILRLWEQAGSAGEITVTLPAGMKAAKAKPVTLRGEAQGEAVDIKDGKFTVNLGAWAPKSFVIE